MFECEENEMTAILVERIARAGFGIVYLGGLAVLIATVVNSFAPVYQVVTLV